MGFDGLGKGGGGGLMGAQCIFGARHCRLPIDSTGCNLGVIDSEGGADHEMDLERGDTL